MLLKNFKYNIISPRHLFQGKFCYTIKFQSGTIAEVSDIEVNLTNHLDDIKGKLDSGEFNYLFSLIEE